MSFSNAEDVMRTVEQLVKSVVTRLSQEVSFARENDEFVPILTNSTALQLVRFPLHDFCICGIDKARNPTPKPLFTTGKTT